jgi:DNA-binding beta-propeller fold protein YncE
VEKNKVPGLADFTLPFALAVGIGGRLYTAGSRKCHIIDSTLTQCKTFADDCGQAFAIAVGKSGNVYVPMQTENTVCVFSPDGDSLFRFGGPDRAPLPPWSLHIPVSIALDSSENVYVGIGLQNVSKFDKEGKFLDQFGARANFEGSLPKPMCTDPSGKHLYVAIELKKAGKVKVYSL